MAQIWTESCQWTTDAAKFIRRYNEGFGVYSGGAGRNGGPAYSGRWGIIPIDPVATGNVFIFFVRIRVDGPQGWLGIGGNSVTSSWAGYVDCFLQVSSDGRLQLRRPNSSFSSVVVAESPPGLFTFVSTLYGVAGKITIHPTTGTCDLWVDGLAVPGLSGLTGLNTSWTGATTWNQFVTENYYRCDLFVADGTNPTGNDVHDALMDVRVDYRQADGNGYTAGFIGNDGNSTDNYLLVDDPTPDDDATYVQSLTAAVDSYGVQNAPAGMQVIGVTSLVTSRKTDAGVAVFRQGLRPASANYMSASYALAVSYVTHSRQHGVNPSGNVAWTEAAFNATEVVVEKV